MRYLLPIIILLFSLGCKTPKELIPYYEGGMYGLMDENSRKRVKAKFDYAEQCYYSRFVSVRKDRKSGLINYKGDIVIPCLYDYILDPDKYGLVRVRLDGKWGMLDTLNNVVIPPQFDNLYGPYDGFWLAEVNKLKGLLDVRGDTIFPFEYDFIDERSITSGKILVKKEDKWGFVDTLNNVIIPLIYSNAKPFYHGLASVQLDGKYGAINDKNEVIIPFDYSYLRDFNEGIAFARQDLLYGAINTQNEVVIPFEYTDVYYSLGNLHVVKKDKLWGMIGLDNQVVIPFEYSFIKTFIDGYATVRKDKLYGVIDTNNRIVIPVKYPDFHEFNNGKVYIRKGDKYYGYVDTFGNETFQPDFNIFSPEWGPIDAPPAIISKNTVALHSPHNAEWGLPLVLKLVLSALRGEPKTYGNYDEEQLTKVCIAYGLCLSFGNYSEKLNENRKSWQAFKQKTIYKILGSEKLRQAAWAWAMPYVKISFQTMHPYHRQIYKNCGAYLNNYMATYNVRKVRHYMKYQERRFAHYNLAGQPDPYRKLGAFVDRLIVMHKVMSVKDAQQWVARINTEVQAW